MKFKTYNVALLLFIWLTFLVLHKQYHILRNVTKKEWVLNNGDLPFEEQKLYFIVHVGNAKTGTTTFQCGLRGLEKKDALPEDVKILEIESCHSSKIELRKFQEEKNLTIVPFRRATYDNILAKNSFMPHCIRNWKRGTGMPECWKDSYLRHIKEHEKQGHSLIVSQEILSRYLYLSGNDHAHKGSSIGKPNHGREFLHDFIDSLGPRFHTIFIVTHRNYFEWIYSSYTQVHKNPARISLIKWPEINSTNGNNGMEIPTPEQFYNSIGANHALGSTTDRIIKFFAQGKDLPRHSLKIIKINSGSDITTKMFCEALPKSMNMCPLAKETKDNRMNTSPDTLFCDKLATSAYLLGLINNSKQKIPRRQVRIQIEEYQKSKGLSCQDFPKVCPSAQFYESLYKKSLAIELEVFQDDPYDNLEQLHLEAFQKIKPKFCTINTSAVLETQEWQSFFKSRFS